MHMQTQKLNQQANECTIDCARHISKQSIKCKNETSQKKCTTNFVNTKQKKDVTTQRKKQNTNNIYVSNAYNTIVDKHARKSAPAGFESPEKPGQRRQQDFWEIETADQFF